jgi:AraC family transcriptional regulator
MRRSAKLARPKAAGPRPTWNRHAIVVDPDCRSVCLPSVRSLSHAVAMTPGPLHDARDRAIVSVRAGGVRVRHQSDQPFHLAYAGDRPILLYVFQGAGPMGAGHARWRNGSFGLLLPGAAAEIDHPEPLDLLAVAYDRPGPFAIRAGAASCGLTDRGVRVLAQELRRVLREEDAADLRYVEALADGLLTRAAGVAAPPPTRAVTQPLPPQKVRRLVDHIEQHLDQGLPVAELAALADLSRPHFTRAFQAALGESPHRFVLRRRLAAARQYLDRGTEDLATIAVRCGFSSHAHLSSAFRAEFGISPSAYRRGLAAAPARLA